LRLGTGRKNIKGLLAVPVVSLALLLASPVLARVQLDHGTAEKLMALGTDTSQIVQEDDIGSINQILASNADDATKKAQIEKLIAENQDRWSRPREP
jgi:hypothetical protein